MVRNFSKTPLFYLANPYTHPDPLVMACRAELVDKAAARLLTHGVMTYPPIALNCRWTNYEKNFPHTWDFWEGYDKNFLERCDGLIVLKLDGWENSIGVKSEIEYAKELGYPVVYVTFDEIMTNDSLGLLEILKVRSSLSTKLLIGA